jgi:hypothetical protein
MKMCSVSGCEKPVRARGWCSTHHQRWRMHGDPLALKISPAGSGTINDCGYRMLRDGGERGGQTLDFGVGLVELFE